MIRTKRNGIEYGGTSGKYYWDKSLNPNATISLGLADCTTYVYGRVLEEGLPKPVGRIYSGGYWHRHLINNWTEIPFDINNVKAGDLIEWQAKNHIIYVEKVEDGKIYISSSSYTGMHGKCMYNGSYDTRNFDSLQEMSDWMIKNYEYRFFHYVTLDKEIQWCGGQPEYISRYVGQVPTAEKLGTPVEKNIYNNQIQVITKVQNVRDNNNNILGVANPGYYNVISTKKSNGYTWYQFETGKWIAGIAGRVIYITASKVDPAKPTFIKDKNYTLLYTCVVRTGPGTKYTAKKKSQLTANGKKHANSAGNLLKGTVITCMDSKEDNQGNVWVQCPSGWIVGYYNKQVIIK